MVISISACIIVVSSENIVVTILIRQDPGIWQFWLYFLILLTNSYIKITPNIAKIAKSPGLAEVGLSKVKTRSNRTSDLVVQLTATIPSPYIYQ